MKLYGHPDSGHALKVKFCLNSASIEHEYEVIDIFSDKNSRNLDFVNRSKHCEVPLLVDGDKNLTQSNAILVYIAKKFQLYGANSDSELLACLEWLMWESNKIGMCLPQLRADKKLKSFELSNGAREWLLARYIHDVGVINNELKDARPYIVGENLTIADFSLCGYLMYAEEAEVDIPKNVDAWRERLKNLNGWSNPYEMLSTNKEG
jgi:glutathione S-transferase